MMKKAYVRIAIAASLAAIGLLVGSCSHGPSATVGATRTVPLTIAIPSVNPGLAAALGAGAVAPASAAGRALMFLTRYNIIVNDTSKGTTDVLPDVILESNGPGGGNNQTTLQLIPGDTYSITVNGYNDGMAGWSILQGTRSGIMIPTGTGSSNFYIDITLIPINAVYTQGSPGSVVSDYWSQGTYADGYTLHPSLYNRDYPNPPDPITNQPTPPGKFLATGGERWYSMYVPYGSNVLTVELDPTANGYTDNNAIVFAELFDQNGDQIGGFGLSPIFTGGLTSKVQIIAGVTPGTNVYLAYVVIQETTSTDPSVITNPMTGNPEVVNITVLPSTIYDDAFENSYGNENDTRYYAYSLGNIYTPYNLIGAEALDQDWYFFTAPYDGYYTITLNAAFSATGELRIEDNYGMQLSSDWSYNDTAKTVYKMPPDPTTQNPYPSSLWLTGGNTYYIKVKLNGQDPVMRMPILGGQYSITIQ